MRLRVGYPLGADGAWQRPEQVFDATVCGDWAAPYGGFTGTFWGLACIDVATREVWADFSWFDYRPL